MVRLLIDDVTLLKGDDVTAHIRFKGGATQTLSIELPKPAWALRQTPPEVVTMVDRLLDDHTDGQISHLLNEHGLLSGEGKRFHPMMVARIRKSYGLKSRYLRLRARGMLDQCEIASLLNVKPATIKVWRRAGLLVAHAYDDRGQCLFEPPGDNAPVKGKRQGKTGGRRRHSATITPTIQ
jgi:hypothetical protein